MSVELSGVSPACNSRGEKRGAAESEGGVKKETGPQPKLRTGFWGKTGNFRMTEFLLDRSSEFLAIAFACEGRFEATLFAGRHKESVALYFADNILLLHLTFEATQSAFKRLAIT